MNIQSQIKSPKKGIALLTTIIFSLWLFISFGSATARITNTDTQEKQVKLDTTFSYQGQLNQEGSPADGIYDFVFRLYTSGSGTNQVGEDFLVKNVNIADGLFTVQLDFGSGVFNGDARWLEISIAVAGENPVPLTPLQPLTAVPYALYGEDADADPTNELQSFIISGTQVSLSNGGGSFNLITGEKGDKGDTGDTGPASNLKFEVGQIAISNLTFSSLKQASEIFTIPVSFDQPYTTAPVVTFSPVTQNPGGINLSISEISNDGFVIYGIAKELSQQAITLDSEDLFGRHPSMVVVNGKPAISYHDTQDGSLKFIRAIDKDGTKWGSPLILDSNLGTLRVYSSLKIVNGKPAISYSDEIEGDLKFIQANDIDGASWKTPLTLDSEYDVGRYNSLEVVNGKPAVSYLDLTNLDLKYVQATNPDGTAWGTPLVLDSEGLVGSYSSLKVINGKPAISYYHQGNRDLKYIRANDIDGASWGTPLAIDTEGLVGQFPSLEIVNGKPAISYSGLLNSTTHKELKYIRAIDIDGNSWGSPIVIDDDEQAGSHSSLTVLNNIPSITYYRKESEDLVLVQALDSEGVSWGSPLILESENNVGLYNSLTVVNNKLAVSYFSYDGDIKGNLKYLRVPIELQSFQINWIAVQP